MIMKNNNNGLPYQPTSNGKPIPEPPTSGSNAVKHKENNKRVLYICDLKACLHCNSHCNLTSDVSHAKNFEIDPLGQYVEKKEVEMKCKTMDVIKNQIFFDENLDNQIKNIVDKLIEEARVEGEKQCVIAAVKKQIPKKPFHDYSVGIDNGCPDCGNIVCVDDNFCPTCGQAIDWSE